MAAKSGAGASVSSGADYQARVGAYLCITSLCSAENELVIGGEIASIGFETTEAIDDINVSLRDGRKFYIQAKSQISFSIGSDGQLSSVLEQFARQHEADANVKFVLVTGSGSSRKVTHDMRAALNAFRDSPEKEFRRDQPKALVELIEALTVQIGHILKALGVAFDLEKARRIIRASYVYVIDVEDSGSLVCSLQVLLHARKYAPASAVFSKILTDCLTHSKRRHTIDCTQIIEKYSRYLTTQEPNNQQARSAFLQMDFSGFQFPVGREVVLCEAGAGLNFPSGTYIFEFYRFDEQGEKRIGFFNNIVKLGDGTEMKSLVRTATMSEMQRILKETPELLDGREITIMPMNCDDDLEIGHVAELYRETLKNSVLENSNVLQCLHCGRAISSNNVHLVEIDEHEEISVGLVHDACREANDRVLGSVYSELFENVPGFVNVDLNKWFQPGTHGQQGFYSADSLVKASHKVMLWGGPRHQNEAAGYVIEMLLVGGKREFVTVRNGIHRFTKDDAEAFSVKFNDDISTQVEQRNPFCLSDETKQFAVRSILLEQVGGKEKIIAIESTRVRKFDQRFAARYESPGHWYAPLIAFRSISNGAFICVDDGVLMLRDPLKSRMFVENWMSCGIDLENFESFSILDDRAFDELISSDEYRGVIVDPIFDEKSPFRLLSGFTISKELFEHS